MLRLKAIIALIVWVSIVTILSLVQIDGPDLESFIDYDKVVHVIFYLVMSYLMSKALAKDNIVFSILAFIVCSAYGYLMEYLQAILDYGRHFDFYDIIANIIGSLIGILIYRFTN